MTQIKEKRTCAREELSGKYLTFQLGNEQYGLQILKVREIIGLMHITAVPRTPADIRGVINLRGRIIPVIDLRTKFGMDQIEDTNESCIIVVDSGVSDDSNMMGILVDRVREVMDIKPEEIEPAPTFGDGVDCSFVHAMAKEKDKVTILLSTERIVADTRKISTNETQPTNEI
ncbi:MAG: purine-binding chemotaxis protein CheW [Planctomycetota bacterium]|jgi:purine-binding chemotaxis protein CheW